MSTRLEILQDALTVREQEVLYYQINIDNFTAAVAEIDAGEEDAHLTAFRNELVGKLAGEIREQKKSKIMLAVIQKQVDALTTAESAT